MQKVSSILFRLSAGCFLAAPAFAATIYNNLTPNNLMAVASRPDTSASEIEAADDFFIGSQFSVTSATFVGLIVPGVTGGPSTISDLVAEIYRVFPQDSNATRTPNVL